ncbi:hypothetical protein TNCV_5102431 [Trichonephila clavipes]|nr:hypothetical protein TNCV_5102431 [Trichonephila clavipes]
MSPLVEQTLKSEIGGEYGVMVEPVLLSRVAQADQRERFSEKTDFSSVHSNLSSLLSARKLVSVKRNLGGFRGTPQRVTAPVSHIFAMSHNMRRKFPLLDSCPQKSSDHLETMYF